MPRYHEKVELAPATVVKICRIVFAGANALRLELGQTSGLQWEQLPQRTRNEIEIGVRDIATRKAKVPADLHVTWRDAMRRDGWDFGLVRDAERRTHPAICAFDELPVMEQAKYQLFFTMTQTLVVHFAAAQAVEQGQT